MIILNSFRPSLHTIKEKKLFRCDRYWVFVIIKWSSLPESWAQFINLSKSSGFKVGK